MVKNLSLSGFVLVTLLALVINAPLSAAEKLKYGTAVKMNHPMYLPLFAAEENGFWAQNGLQVEWLPFRRPALFHKTLAAGFLNIGTAPTTSIMLSVTRGVPGVMVAEILPLMEFFIWFTMSQQNPYSSSNPILK